MSSGASTLEGGCELYSGPQEERVLRTPEEGFSSPEPSPGRKSSFPSDLGLHQTLPYFMRKQVCRRLEQADTTGQRTPTRTPQDPSSAEELRKSCLKTRGCDWRQASGRPAPINKAVGTNKDYRSRDLPHILNLGMGMRNWCDLSQAAPPSHTSSSVFLQ